MARHIRDSSEQKLVATEAGCNWWKDGSFDTNALAIAHDELKYAGGWYNDDFYGSAVVKKKRVNEDRVQSYRRLSLEDATVVFSQENELQYPLPMTSKYPSLFAHLEHGSDPNWVSEYMEQAGRALLHGPPAPMDISELPQRNALENGIGEIIVSTHYESFLYCGLLIKIDNKNNVPVFLIPFLRRSITARKEPKSGHV